MHMTGMEQFGVPNKRKYSRDEAAMTAHDCRCCSLFIEPVKGQGKKGSSNAVKNPLASSIAPGASVGSKNPGTSHMN